MPIDEMDCVKLSAYASSEETSESPIVKQSNEELETLLCSSTMAYSRHSQIS
jgi:hypothetical protein